MTLQHTRDQHSTTERIALLNDHARAGLDRPAKIVLTTNLLNRFSDGTRTSDIMAQARIMHAMRKCSLAEDCPERDLAIFEVDTVRVMMKIDYYDNELEYGSEDPADASITRRVITLMLPEDY